MSDPAVRELAALEKEISLVVCAAAQGKGFADDDRLTPVELLKELDLVINLALLGIQMRRDKIELFGSCRVCAREREHSQGDQVRLVVLTDGGDHAIRPLAEDIVTRAIARL